MFKCSHLPFLQYSDVQIFICSDVQMFRYSDVQIFRFSDDQMFKCTNIQMFKWPNLQIFKSSNAHMFNILMFQCSNVPMFKVPRAAEVIWRSPILSWPRIMFFKRVCYDFFHRNDKCRKWSVWRKKTVVGFPSTNMQWISLFKHQPK